MGNCAVMRAADVVLRDHIRNIEPSKTAASIIHLLAAIESNFRPIQYAKFLCPSCPYVHDCQIGRKQQEK